jgi:hypothetical protein
MKRSGAIRACMEIARPAPAALRATAIRLARRRSEIPIDIRPILAQPADYRAIISIGHIVTERGASPDDARAGSCDARAGGKLRTPNAALPLYNRKAVSSTRDGRGKAACTA